MKRVEVANCGVELGIFVDQGGLTTDDRRLMRLWVRPVGLEQGINKQWLSRK